MSAAATSASTVRAYLERRRAALNEEVRRYPTPIARCDVQLAGLIDERDAVTRLLREPDDAEVLRGFAAGTLWWSDAEAQALRAAMADAA
jgi:hypothetical protein